MYLFTNFDTTNPLVLESIGTSSDLSCAGSTRWRDVAVVEEGDYGVQLVVRATPIVVRAMVVVVRAMPVA
jgi:hypothetical protein